MKRRLLITIPFLILFSSFLLLQNPEESKDNIFPDMASEFIKKHFREFEIQKITFNKKKKRYKVCLKSGHETAFNDKGEWLEVKSEYKPIPKSIIDMLPRNINLYIARNYPRRAILKIEREECGYEVELSNSLELHFDKNGNILKSHH